MPPFESPLADASPEEIKKAIDKLDPPPNEKAKIIRLEDYRKQKEAANVTELSEEDLEEIPNGNIELSEADLEEIPEEEELALSEDDLEEIPGGIHKAELHTIESKEGGWRFKIGAASEASPAHPDRNEDAYYYSAKRGIQFVADGMGGVPAGDYASAAAAEQLTRLQIESMAPITKKVYEANINTPLTKDEVEAATGDILQRMNDAVERLGQENETVQTKARESFKEQLGQDFDPSKESHKKVMDILLKQIGCTASLSKVWRNAEGKEQMTIGQVGDSRIYRLRKGGLERLTREDSHVQVLIDEGIKDKNGEPVLDDADVTREIDKKDIIALAEKRKELAPLVMKLVRNPNQYVTLDSFRNMITQGIGLQKIMKEQFGTEFKPRIKTVELEDGDLVLTVSDGVGDNLTDAEIQTILVQNENDPLKAAKELQTMATERAIRGKDGNARAKMDDVTAIVTAYKKA